MSSLVRIADDVYTIPAFFSVEECESWIALSETMGFEPAPVITLSGPQRRESIRNNARVLYDNAGRAGELWRRLEAVAPGVLPGRTAVGLNERMRFYRYDVGQRFHWHGDGVFRRGDGEQSLLTFIVYLNDNFTGGETRFGSFRIEPETGKALLFSHWQRHMGAEVLSGRKYVLRSDVMYAQEY